jgi:hypothetical protein
VNKEVISMASRAPATGLEGHAGWRTRCREWTRRHARLPVLRIAFVFVLLSWAVLAVLVETGTLQLPPAPFYAAAALAFAVVGALVYDVAVEWVDPEEQESLPRRLQPEVSRPVLQRIVAFLQIGAVPLCFLGGVLLGHLEWH